MDQKPPTERQQKLFEMMCALIGHTSYTTRGYSGRCMYGRRCLAVVTEDEPVTVAVNILQIAHNYYEDEYQFNDVCETVSGMTTDNMGRDEVVCYWTGVPWIGKDATDEDEDDE